MVNDEGHPDDTKSSEHRYRGDLFQHLPGLLQYPPQRSVVVAGCRGTSLTTTATIDLTERDILGWVRRTGIIGEMLGNDLCDNAKLLFIDPEEDRLALFGHSQLIGLLTSALNKHGIADIEPGWPAATVNWSTSTACASMAIAPAPWPATPALPTTQPVGSRSERSGFTPVAALQRDASLARLIRLR